jgi:hypothetical protein
LDKVTRLAGEASAGGAALAVFPEAFLPAHPRGIAFGTVVGDRTAEGRDGFGATSMLRWMCPGGPVRPHGRHVACARGHAAGEQPGRSQPQPARPVRPAGTERPRRRNPSDTAELRRSPRHPSGLWRLSHGLG